MYRKTFDLPIQFSGRRCVFAVISAFSATYTSNNQYLFADKNIKKITLKQKEELFAAEGQAGTHKCTHAYKLILEISFQEDGIYLNIITDYQLIGQTFSC